MLRHILATSILLAGHAHASGNPPAPVVGAAGSTCGYVTDQRATIPKSQDIFPVEITRIDGRSTPLDARNRHSVQPGERVLTVTDHIDPHRLPGAAVSQIAKMKPGAHLINASRGTVVDIDALDAALRSGQVGGAAIDVFPVEPKGNDDAFESPLLGHDNVLLTPHVGGSTLEAQDNIGLEVATKLIRYSDNGSTLSAVNFPEVTLPEHAGSHRILHIHRNVPGVLSKINEIFSERGINIDGQYLRTDPNVGYVVIDVAADSGQASELRSALSAIPGTLRTRVLY